MKADLSHVVVIVPVGALDDAKSRLGGALDPEERRALVTVLLDRTVRAATAGFDTVVVSPSPEVLAIGAAAGAEPLAQSGTGLNEALELGTVVAAGSGATAVLVVPADLPAVSADALEALVANAHAAVLPDRPLVAIVPDRHGRGTNALLVSPPGVIGYAFGPDSRASHREAADEAHAVWVELDGPLALDVDTADDLALAEPLLVEPLDAV